jgi:hypothetical protein
MNFIDIELNLEELNKICNIEYIQKKIGNKFNQIITEVGEKIY